MTSLLTGALVTGLVTLPDGVLFAVTDDGDISRFDPAVPAWTVEAMTGQHLLQIDGWDLSHLWAVGPNLWARSSDGGWAQTPGVPAQLSALRADPDAGRVWLGGTQMISSLPYEYIGWLEVSDGGLGEVAVNGMQLNGQIFAIAGAAPDLWAAGFNGALFRWSGSSWLPVETGSRQTINALVLKPRPDAGDDLWLVGNSGSVLHYRD
jgi:hypothetical protein